MLLTDDSYYSATYPHSPSHRHPRVTKIDGGREKRPPTPSETRQGGIHRAVVRSPAVAIARRAQARPMPQGPHPGRGPGRQRCCPPLPPARAEPRPPRPVPSSLDHRTPHPRQEFREPPRPPPPPPPPPPTPPQHHPPARWSAPLPAPPPPLTDGHDNADNQCSIDAARDPLPEDDKPLGTESALLLSLPPRAGGCVSGAEHQLPVAPVIAQPLGQVPPHGRPSSS
jgi:hypothetical protein